MTHHEQSSDVPHAVLSLRGVTKSFGGVTAVQDLSLDVSRGQIHGLIGPNGAGKSTVVNLAAGVFSPDHGRVNLDGSDVTRLRVHQRAKRGLGRTFQGSRASTDLTVEESVLVATEQAGDPSTRSRRDRRGFVATRLAETGLADVARVPVHSLPYGRQKQLEVARALTFGHAVLLLDEPAAGLNGDEVRGFSEFLRSHRGDRGVLLIEHNVELVLALCDVITVVVSGRSLMTGSPAAVRDSAEVRDAYLGTGR